MERQEADWIVEARGVTKRFGTLEVLRGIDFCVARGEVVGIVGASGAGKSTFLQILGTLDRPDKGTVRLLGDYPARLSGRALSRFRNQHIGFVFQAHRLLPEFSALENVMIPALIGKASTKSARKDAMGLLEAVGLADRATHKPAELSGGERQRVAIARALVQKPDLLLADEPSGSLDSHTKTEIHQLLLEVRERFGQTLVVVMHDSTLAALCDRVCAMKDGLLAG